MLSSGGAADDSGYVVISLREFWGGRDLYDDVYSLFGPAYFVLVGGSLKLLGGLTVDGARYADFAIWLASSLLAGLALLHLTRSFLVAVTGLLLAFKLLSALTFTPLHPVSSISLGLITMVCAAALLLPGRPRAALGAIGALAAVLLAIKVNVGALAFAAIGGAALATMPRLRELPRLRLAGAALLALLPFLLLSGNLNEPWAMRYAIAVSLGILAWALAAATLPPASVPRERDLGWLAAGAGGLLAVVVAVPLVRGMSPGGLIRGVVLDPLEVPGLFVLPLNLDALAPVWPALGLAAVLLARRASSRGAPRDGPPRDNPSGDPLGPLGGIGRLAAGLALWLVIAWPSGFVPSTAAIALGAGVAWMVAMPPGRVAADASFLRALLGGLAVLQLLHAYPVGGNQLAPSQLLLVIAGGICIADGSRALAGAGPRLRASLPAGRVLAPAALAAFALWLCLVPVRDTVRAADDNYAATVPLELPGAERIRFAPGSVERFRELTAAVRSRCDAFITRPGMNSLYLYTEQDPPTGINGTHWMWLFDSERQQRVVDEVEGVEGLCVVDYPWLASFYGLGPAPDRPLIRFIDEEFEETRAFGLPFDRYHLLERRGALD